MPMPDTSLPVSGPPVSALPAREQLADGFPDARLTLRLASGAALVLPATLDAITTYVVLEQEAWFEKEAGFLAHWLAPGMTAIDIGANHGVYAVPMARAVAPRGRVFAYEPASAPRRLLEKSRDLNGCSIDVRSSALSDAPRHGRLLIKASSELNRLAGASGARDGKGAGNLNLAESGEPASGEPVEITCLDAETGWSIVDFVKIDAEGEEERILAGGRNFFANHSPLVMFEVKSGDRTNENWRGAFAQTGYRVFRLLGGAPLLVPDDPAMPLDGYELNLFAAKPDRVADLAAQGRLVEAVPPFAPNAAAREDALAQPRALPFADGFSKLFAPSVAARLDNDYRDGLAAFAVWRSPGRSLAERHAALEFAVARLTEACARAASPPRLVTLARAAWEAGRRSIAVTALLRFLDACSPGRDTIDEPFWPAAPRFDVIASRGNPAEWFVVSALEQLVRTASFSSYFGTPGIDLGWLSGFRFASREMERRHVLRRARAGEKVEVPLRLRVSSPDHVNAPAWRSGAVPNTFVR